MLKLKQQKNVDTLASLGYWRLVFVFLDWSRVEHGHASANANLADAFFL